MSDHGENWWTARDPEDIYEDDGTSGTSAPSSTTELDDLYAELEDLQAQQPSRQYTVLTGSQITDSTFWQTYGEALNPGGALGEDADLASIYASMPVAIGYYTDPNDPNSLVIEKPSSTAYRQYQLANMQAPELEDLTQTEGYQSLQDLLASLGQDQSGNAQGFLDQLVGGDYSSIMQNLQGATQPVQNEEGKWDPFANMAGLGPEEKAQYEQWMQQQVDGWILQRQEALDAIAPYSSIQAFNQMDEISSQIADFATSSRLKYMEMDQAQKKLQYETMKQSYDSMLSAGMQGTEIFYNQLNQNRMVALQTGLGMIDAVARQNTQELDKIGLEADLLYKSIMTDLGVESQMLDNASTYYDMAMSQWLEEYSKLLDKINIKIGIEGTQGGTVICTELHRQGLMSDELYAADASYGWLMERVNPEIVRGYRLWATEFVRLMRHSKLFTRLVALLAIPWAREMSYRMGQYKHGNMLGKLLFCIGTPICRWLGRRYERTNRQAYHWCYR